MKPNNNQHGSIRQPNVLYSMTQIQRILEKAKAIVIPGIYDTLSAKIAEQVGFPIGFVSGYSVAATMIGEPDLGLLTQTEMIERARHICVSVSIPVIIDADTGYGNPLNVYRTIKELIAAGAAGCFLEDQVWHYLLIVLNIRKVCHEDFDHWCNTRYRSSISGTGLGAGASGNRPGPRPQKA